MFYEIICTDNVWRRPCGHFKQAWQAEKYPQALHWAPLVKIMLFRLLISWSSFDLLKNVTFDLLKFDLLIISPFKLPNRYTKNTHSLKFMHNSAEICRFFFVNGNSTATTLVVPHSVCYIYPSNGLVAK
jgi:hypothetical protein